MMKKMLAAALVLVLLAAAIPALADLGTGTVKGGWLRMRSAPTTLGAVIGRYYTGTKVTVHSQTGTWYYVTAPDGKVGYMSRNYVTLAGGGYTPSDGSWSGVPSGESGYVTSQNGKGVRLRSSPSAANSGNVIGLYNVGTKLTVLQRGVGWHYIQIGSQTGFMMSKFIVIGGSPAPVPPIDPIPDTHYTAYVTSQNGKGVRMRTGPSTSYSTMGTYPVGTKVTVLKNLGSWSYIQIASKTGYMMSQFLTTYAPTPVPPVGPSGTIETAQITIQNPIIGDRLYVYVTPENADYNVHWYNELGTLLGSGNGYPVKNSDTGHRIRARVTGRNNWTGSADTLFTDIISSGKPGPALPLTGSIKLPTVVQVNEQLTAQVYDCNATALDYTWYVDGMEYSEKKSIKTTSAMAGKSVQVVVTASGFTGSLTAVTMVQAAEPVTPPSDSGVEFITPGDKTAEPETPPIVEDITPEPLPETEPSIIEVIPPLGAEAITKTEAEVVSPEPETVVPVTEPAEAEPIVEAIIP